MNLHPALAWLGHQLHILASVISAVAAGGVLPARQVAACTFVLVVLLAVVVPLIIRIGRKLAK